jgi:predicted Zn-dependent peptidase
MKSRSILHGLEKAEGRLVNNERQDFDVRKTELDNGLVVVSEKMSHVRSVSFGVFLRSGSRRETESQHGLTHFIEHALFKGTRRRSAAQIAAETDELGGNLDAFTGREIVGFYNKVLDEHLPRAFGLIADLVTAPAFDPDEMKKERNVILEEIKMVEDTPDDIVFDIFCENFYPNHPLGRPILGTPRTLSKFKPNIVRSYYEQIFRPGNLVIAAAGNLEHEEVIGLTEQFFGQLEPGSSGIKSIAPIPTSTIIKRHKSELEQAHLVIGAPCPSAISDDRYVAHLLTVILGGGMSSRLFQSIREDRGLVYTIFSAINPFSDCGYLTIYAGASREQLGETIAAVMKELERIKREPVDGDELQRNKDQLKASLVLNLESPSARMSSLAQQEINFGRFFSPDEIIGRVDAVTSEDLLRMGNNIFSPAILAATVLGDLNGFTLEREQLQC